MAAGDRAGEAGATPVKDDQPAKRRQCAAEQADPGVFPGDVDVGEAPGGQHEVGWPVAEDLVGDPVALQACVPGLRRHGPSTIATPGRILKSLRRLGTIVLA
jgi:hypothetical protein